MDRPGSDPDLLADDLRNLRIINRCFGGLRVIRRHVFPLIDRIERQKEIEILDLATGSADYPLDLAKLIRRLGRNVHIVAVDNNPFMVATARKRTAAFPGITVRDMDVLSLAYPDRSFDVVLCSSAIHHFSRCDAVHLLREMCRLSRVGFIVNDLDRSRLGAWTAWLYGRLSTTNPITRHDAYASFLRAFTKNELIAMSQEAGIQSFVVTRQAFFRLILVGVHV
jgi:ubiquinone/menaquinone biosynthesis C-methylase UbiE